MKFSTVSDSFRVSSTQRPGRGSGTLAAGTGSHMEVVDFCSLNLPSKAASTSSKLKVQMAEPVRPLCVVVKTAWKAESSLGLLKTSWISLKKNGNSPGSEQLSLAFK